ncbi:hypothetical protein CAPN004_17290 [Capnocytophaga cynodegmi]|uniref:Uncharacterized protein n=1 Tax=Capnocytophaga cynodegmi TaxID=28189 RepID=A0A0B7HVC0_9FLAO|nr:hypothetical protein CAPN004_17290 [Capnocytophaga cynodegmi]CEN33468.1 hypothetical protein CCYN74_10018 [Capnocytophaga cynodegmi]CEN41847.1 hypothetical protein CCYN49044_60026 [Capnocytophaga cynodegmi]
MFLLTISEATKVENLILKIKSFNITTIFLTLKTTNKQLKIKQLDKNRIKIILKLKFINLVFFT